jgi:drug/metabolite transporter (DMT)-like permease
VPKWFLYSLLTMAAWGVWSLLAIPLNHLSAAQSQAFSTAGILPLMAAVWLSPRTRHGLHKRRGSLYSLAAGGLVGLGNLAYYQILSMGTQAAVAVALTALYPLGTIALGFLFLRERPNPIQLLGIVAALAAIALINLGGSGQAQASWMMYAMAPILLWGSAGALMKIATAYVSAELAVFWFLAAFIPLGVLLAAIEPMTWSLSARDWLLVSLLGFTYALGNLTLLAAYRADGKASVVTPMAGLYPVVAIPLAIVCFNERVGPWQWAGIGLALLAVLGLVYERKPPAPVTDSQPLESAPLGSDTDRNKTILRTE